MTIWSARFATRAGAERAAAWGSLACWFQAVRETLGNIFVVSLSGKPIDIAIAYFVGASLLPIFLIVTGVRLWRKSGWIFATLAALGVTLELAEGLLTTFPRDYYTVLVAQFASDVPVGVKAALITSFATKVAIVVLMLNGARGAFALRKVDCSADAESASA